MPASKATRFPPEAMSDPISRAQYRDRTSAAAAAAPATARAADPVQIRRNPARAMRGQCAKLRRHHGSDARRSSSANTRFSRVGGARRGGSSRSVRSSRRSSGSWGSFMSVLEIAGGDAPGLQEGQQRRAGAPYVGLDLGKRGTKLRGDFLVGEILEVIQHQRQPLMLGKLAQRGVNQFAALFRAQIREQRVGLRSEE